MSTRLPEQVLQQIRHSRTHPRITQFDYLHLRRLVDDLAKALRGIPHPVADVLDVFCGVRPYEELLPAGSQCIGLDIDDRYGAVDVVSDEFLPFDDDSFDLVICIEAFYYVADPVHGVSEILRVLRPGGTAVITVPLVWEYDRTILEHRFTGPELEALFSDWDDVGVVENGGRGVSWSLLTGHLVYLREKSLPWRARRVMRPLFAGVYALVNGLGALIEAGERRRGGPYTLPVNLLLTARKPPS
jgi:SAM-dependent methyltransferase